jgi:hypothetical protein
MRWAAGRFGMTPSVSRLTHSLVRLGYSAVIAMQVAMFEHLSHDVPTDRASRVEESSDLASAGREPGSIHQQRTALFAVAPNRGGNPKRKRLRRQNGGVARGMNYVRAST